MDEFSRHYLQEEWSFNDYAIAKQAFFEKNNAEINIFNQKGESIKAILWQSQPWYYVTCTTENEEEMETSRKEFVANVSHELKTPLGIMLCYVESLQDNISCEKTKEYYDVLKGEINKMNIMVLQMLELAKAESGDIALDITKFSIKNMLDDVLVLYSFQAQERGITIDIQGDFANVSADFAEIEQVCTNLIGNAVRHSLLKSSIKIIGKIKDSKNRISIVNNCEPITQTEAQKLWERFYKADKSHKESGTGLGLSIVAAILGMHRVEYGVIAHENSIEFYFELETITTIV